MVIYFQAITATHYITGFVTDVCETESLNGLKGWQQEWHCKVGVRPWTIDAWGEQLAGSSILWKLVVYVW